MDLYVMNKSLETIGIIDAYQSVIWTKRYFSAGDFELYLPATTKIIDLLQTGNYIYRIDDESVMIIEKIQLKTDAENGNYLTVSGRSIESILTRRIVWTQTIIISQFNNFVKRLLNENIISPSISARKIDNFIYNDNTEITNRVVKQMTGNNLYDVIVEVCTAYKIGWKITINENKQFVFSLYKGNDISDFVIFSPEFDNLINSNYQCDTTKYTNVALVGGEGEGKDRRLYTTSLGTPTGLSRFEIFVNAGTVSSNEGEITPSEYNEMLSEQGQEALQENAITTAFEGEVETTMYQYKTDWNLGDTVQIENEYGIKAKSQILEVIESNDTSGHKVIPTFGEWEV